MERENAMIYLDTHVLVWLFAGLIEKLSSEAIKLIEDNNLYISPMVSLELTYLHETKKINRTAHLIIHELQTRIGLKICTIPFETIVSKANSLSWTRDPFDRIIVAQAMCASAKLLTKDRTIRKYSRIAIWE